MRSLAFFETGAARWLEASGQYLRLASGRDFEHAYQILEQKMFPIITEVDAAASQLSAGEAKAVAQSNEQAREEI